MKTNLSNYNKVISTEDNGNRLVFHTSEKFVSVYVRLVRKKIMYKTSDELITKVRNKKIVDKINKNKVMHEYDLTIYELQEFVKTCSRFLSNLEDYSEPITNKYKQIIYQ